MKLSTKGRYAVMAMVDLARHAQAKPVSLSDIATRQEISLSYLEQLFARLRRADLVKSVRGPGGGYRLARGSAETRVSEIILAVDEPISEGPGLLGCLVRLVIVAAVVYLEDARAGKQKATAAAR